MTFCCFICEETLHVNLERTYCSECYDKLADDRDHWQDESIRLRHWLERINAGLDAPTLASGVLRLIKSQIGMALTGEKP
jgi:hypothetical protein